MADYFVKYTENFSDEDAAGLLRKESFLQKAMLIYKDVNKGKRSCTHRILLDVQKKIPKLMVPIQISLDLSELYNTIDLNYENLSLEEGIIRLTQLVQFYKKDEIKRKVIGEHKDYYFSHLIPSGYKNANGQTIFKLAPLDTKNPENNPKLLEQHMNHKLLEDCRLSGDTALRYALRILQKKYAFVRDDLRFITTNNAIIPEGREDIFLTGLYFVLTGKYYEGVHILAPQVENLFRNIAREAGGITVRLEDDGSSQELALSRVFDIPELVDCYDRDIIFLFKALLSERSGANIRNLVAHGILDAASASRGECLFFAVATIKLLCFSSSRYYEILKTSKGLNDFIRPSNVKKNAKKL